ncbi:xylan glycosyltransferase MUCI21-like [Silene latifolia]|uniref:xylan glycosyltransferase MUCI21-like n=1 Tax=Silene latifolia TaxID=37657 RepID=UPI003D7797A6
MIKEQVKLSKRAKSKVVYFLCLSFLLCCSLFWVSQIFGIPFSLPCIILYETSEAESFLHEKEKASQPAEMAAELPISSSISNGTMHCDRSHFRTDVCFMKGDIRTHSSSSSIFLYTTQLHSKSSLENQQLIIRPYTRKWETDLMTTIDELHLISKPQPLHKRHHKCDVVHHVPAIFFSTGGYTGNVYHEFNDGIIPLYITSRHYNKKVIFVILEYHKWWYMKYGQLLSQLSDYPPIDFRSDTRTHCFQEAIVGLQIHNELAIDSSIMPKHESILDFRGLLGQAFEPHPPKHIVPNQKKRPNKPKVVVLSRSGPRSITNENTLVKLAQKMGFSVQVLKPKPDIELGTIYKAISSSDVMIGVHGAAMTHFLFLKPGSTVIQVVPLGTDWAAEAYYGEPAKKLGLKYIEYKIDPRESSLYHKYDENDPVLRDPTSVNKKGWEFTKKIYLDDQYVTLNLKRFNKVLIRAYQDYFNTSTSGVTM